METKSFVRLLRKVIREEVGKAIKQALTEQTNHKKVINHGMDLHNLTENPSPRKSVVKKKKSFTKNSMLNDLLNETADTADFGSMSNRPLVMQDMETKDDWPAMKYESSMAEAFGMTRKPQPLATTTTDGRPVDMSNQNVAKTVDIMTKDYSALMKAIDKKKGR